MFSLLLALSLLALTFGQQPDIKCLQAPDKYFVTNTLGCEQYFVCMAGQAVPGVCPVGYKFNPLGQLCDFAKNVDCKQCAQYGIQQIADPNSCTIYYECTNGVRAQKQCAPGLHFNIRNNNCDLASIVNCDREPIGPPTSTSHPPITSPPTLIPPTQRPPPGQYPECKPGGQVFHAHESLCNSFYLCINGYAWLLHCPPQLNWNQAVSACDYPQNAQCNEIRPKYLSDQSNDYMIGDLLDY